MSEIPKPGVKAKEAVDQEFRNLNEILKALAKALPDLEKATLEAAVDLQIDRTHKSVLGLVVEAVRAAETGAKDNETEVIEEAAYRDKLNKLLAFSNPVEYKQMRAIPRDDGSFPWIRALEYFAPKKILGMWMRCVFVRGENKRNGESWIQTLFLSEWDSYDKHAWEKEYGRIMLPVRVKDGQVEAAVTVKNPPGSGGRPVFSGLRSSLSNKNKPIFYGMPAVYEEHDRADLNRSTGTITGKVVLLDEEKLSQVDEAKERIVWFNLSELERLLGDPRMQDAITVSLIRWLLLNAGVARDADLARR